MKIVESLLTKNPCYTAGRKIIPSGLMLHSVGCPQPKASAFISSWNSPSYNSACVHGFIDANDGTVYQTLPWNHRGWHCGGSGNNTHIGVEMCEPACIKYTAGSSFTCSDLAGARAAAQRTYDAAVELFAMLCKKYDLNPLTQICSHREGHSKGIASNHGDPEHLWNGLGMGLSMDGFRKAVKQAMKGETASSPTADTASTPASSSDEKKIWDYLYKKIGNAYGTAGLMGNLYSESGLRSNNMQNSFEKKLGFTDETYTKNVDKGTYSNFVKDGCGYGLAQWTFHTRKQALLDYAKKKGVSIGDLDMQLEFLWNELSGSYKGVLSALKAAKSVRAASDVVLTQFERPADQSDEVKVKRAGFGTTYYNRYAAPTSGKLPTVPFKARVTITDLNIREQPTTDSKVMGQTGAGVFTIVEVKSGKGSTQGWGKLKSGAGYISLDYITGV